MYDYAYFRSTSSSVADILSGRPERVSAKKGAPPRSLRPKD